MPTRLTYEIESYDIEPTTARARNWPLWDTMAESCHRLLPAYLTLPCAVLRCVSPVLFTMCAAVPSLSAQLVENSITLACKHRFCRECVAGYCESKINDAILEITCPDLQSPTTPTADGAPPHSDHHSQRPSLWQRGVSCACFMHVPCRSQHPYAVSQCACRCVRVPAWVCDHDVGRSLARSVGRSVGRLALMCARSLA